jgi:hypothetical protein
MKFLIRIVDAQLLQSVNLKSFTPKNVKNTKRVAVGSIWDGAISKALVAEIVIAGILFSAIRFDANGLPRGKRNYVWGGTATERTLGTAKLPAESTPRRFSSKRFGQCCSAAGTTAGGRRDPITFVTVVAQPWYTVS